MNCKPYRNSVTPTPSGSAGTRGKRVASRISATRFGPTDTSGKELLRQMNSLQEQAEAHKLRERTTIAI